MAQQIKVVVNILDEKYTAKLMAISIADIIEERINKLPEEHRKRAFDILIERLKKNMKDEIRA